MTLCLVGSSQNILEQKDHPTFSNKLSFNFSPEQNIQSGMRDLIISDNFALIGVALSTYSVVIFNSKNGTLSEDKQFGVVTSIGAGGMFVCSYIFKRKGMEKLYWGVNGITIKLI